MQQNQILAETSVDAKTAEKALALAIRLQQERGEQISIAELQRTADEAGIDRESLQRALDQLAKVEAEPRRLGAAPTLVICAVVLVVASMAFPHGSQVATILRAISLFGFLAASYIFIRFLRRQNRL